MKSGASRTFWNVGAGRLIAALALLAYAAHALIPQGWMPVADRAGGFTLVICTAHGAQTVSENALAGDERPAVPAKGGQQDSHQPCPFAASGSIALLGWSVPPLPVPFAAPAQLALSRVALPYGTGRIAPYSSRAPPVFA